MISDHIPILPKVVGYHSHIDKALETISNTAGDTPLIEAVRAGAKDKLIRLLKREADPNEVNAAGWTPLHIAVALQKISCIKVLVENTATNLHVPGPFGWVAFHLAVETGKIKIARLLYTLTGVTIANDAGDTALHIASEYGDRKMATWLLKKYAYIDKQNHALVTPLGLSVYHGHLKLMEFLLFTSRGHARMTNITASGASIIHQALYSGKFSMISLVMQHFYRLYSAKRSPQLFYKVMNALNENAHTPLMMAVSEGYALEVIRVLLQGQFDPIVTDPVAHKLQLLKWLMNESMSTVINYQNPKGETALYLAIKKRESRIVQFLLDRGADPLNHREHDTILQHAVLSNDPEILQAILDRIQIVCSASEYTHMLNQRNVNGNSLFMLASSVYHPKRKILKMLLKAGAKDLSDVTLCNHNGQTSAMKMMEGGTTRVMNWYVQSLAKDGTLIAALTATDNNGLTPLHYAAFNQNKKVLTSILELITTHLKNNDETLHALLNQKNNFGDTPLICAAKVGNFHALQALMTHSAIALDIQNLQGQTALHEVIKRERADFSWLLITHGASVNILNNDYESSLDLVNNKIRFYEGTKDGELWLSFKKNIHQTLFKTQLESVHETCLKYHLKKRSMACSPEQTDKNILPLLMTHPDRVWIHAEPLLKKLQKLSSNERMDLLHFINTNNIIIVGLEKDIDLIHLFTQREKKFSFLHGLSTLSHRTNTFVSIEQFLGPYLNGNYDALAFNAFQISLPQFAEQFQQWGRGLSKLNYHALGRALRLSGPWVKHFGVLPALYFLINDLKCAKKNDCLDTATKVDIGVQSMVLTNELIGGLLEVAELYGVELGLFSFAGPIGALVLSFVLLGQSVYTGIHAVNEIEAHISLDRWEEIIAGTRAAIGLPLSTILSVRLNQKSLYQMVIAKQIEFLKTHPVFFASIQAIVESILVCEKNVHHDRGQAGGCRAQGCGPLHIDGSNCKPMLVAKKDSTIFLNKPLGENAKIDSDFPSSFSERFSTWCVPSGASSYVKQDQENYFCHRSFGIKQEDNKTESNAIFIHIRNGVIVGHSNYSHVIAIEGGVQEITGGMKPDIIMIQGSKTPTGYLYGCPLAHHRKKQGKTCEENNVLDLSYFEGNGEIYVDFGNQKVFFHPAYGPLSIYGFNSLIGRKDCPEKIKVDPSIVYVNSQGGTKEYPDMIFVPKQDDFNENLTEDTLKQNDYSLRLDLNGYTVVHHDAIRGEFNYLIQEAEKISFVCNPIQSNNVQSDRAKKTTPKIFFSYRLADLTKIDQRIEQHESQNKTITRFFFGDAEITIDCDIRRFNYVLEKTEIIFGLGLNNIYLTQQHRNINLSKILEYAPPFSMNFPLIISNQEKNNTIIFTGCHRLFELNFSEENMPSDLISNGGTTYQIKCLSEKNEKKSLSHFTQKKVYLHRELSVLNGISATQKRCDGSIDKIDFRFLNDSSDFFEQATIIPELKKQDIDYHIILNTKTCNISLVLKSGTLWKEGVIKILLPESISLEIKDDQLISSPLIFDAQIRQIFFHPYKIWNATIAEIQALINPNELRFMRDRRENISLFSYESLLNIGPTFNQTYHDTDQKRISENLIWTNLYSHDFNNSNDTTIFFSPFLIIFQDFFKNENKKHFEKLSILFSNNNQMEMNQNISLNQKKLIQLNEFYNQINLIKKAPLMDEWLNDYQKNFSNFMQNELMMRQTRENISTGKSVDQISFKKLLISESSFQEKFFSETVASSAMRVKLFSFFSKNNFLTWMWHRIFQSWIVIQFPIKWYSKYDERQTNFIPYFLKEKDENNHRKKDQIIRALFTAEECLHSKTLKHETSLECKAVFCNKFQKIALLQKKIKIIVKTKTREIIYPRFLGKKKSVFDRGNRTLLFSGEAPVSCHKHDGLNLYCGKDTHVDIRLSAIKCSAGFPFFEKNSFTYIKDGLPQNTIRAVDFKIMQEHLFFIIDTFNGTKHTVPMDDSLPIEQMFFLLSKREQEHMTTVRMQYTAKKKVKRQFFYMLFERILSDTPFGDLLRAFGLSACFNPRDLRCLVKHFVHILESMRYGMYSFSLYGACIIILLGHHHSIHQRCMGWYKRIQQRMLFQWDLKIVTLKVPHIKILSDLLAYTVQSGWSWQYLLSNGLEIYSPYISAPFAARCAVLMQHAMSFNMLYAEFGSAPGWACLMYGLSYLPEGLLFLGIPFLEYGLDAVLKGLNIMFDYAFPLLLPCLVYKFMLQSELTDPLCFDSYFNSCMLPLLFCIASQCIIKYVGVPTVDPERIQYSIERKEKINKTISEAYVPYERAKECFYHFNKKHFKLFSFFSQSSNQASNADKNSNQSKQTFYCHNSTVEKKIFSH